jgi:hypothetical protein
MLVTVFRSCAVVVHLFSHCLIAAVQLINCAYEYGLGPVHSLCSRKFLVEYFSMMLVVV